MIYRGLKFRPSVKSSGGLDVWDKQRGKWFYTALVNDKKKLEHWLTKVNGVTNVALYDLGTMSPAGTLRFAY